jgi:hypothetical protein
MNCGNSKSWQWDKVAAINEFDEVRGGDVRRGLGRQVADEGSSLVRRCPELIVVVRARRSWLRDGDVMVVTGAGGSTVCELRKRRGTGRHSGGAAEEIAAVELKRGR